MRTDISSLKSIQESFQTLKTSFTVLVWAMVFILILSLVSIAYIFKISGERVYIISPHQTFLAYASYNHEVSVFEARNHIRVLCQNLFGWDKDNFNNHMETALNLMDHSDGLKLFNTFKSNEVYENLISTSAKVTVDMDSIQLNMNALPIQGIFYLTQNWQSVGGIQYQKIKAEFELIPVSRSEANPFGLLVQKIAFLKYENNKKDLKDSVSVIPQNP